MIFVRFILFFVALVVVLTASGAILTTLSDGFDIPSMRFGDGMRTYRDRASGVALTYPAAWEREYLGSEMMRFTYGKRTLVYSVKNVETDVVRTLDEYTAENIHEITESAEHDGFTVVIEESAPSSVGGHDGHRIAILMEKDEQIIHAVQYWTIANDRVITISFSAPLNELYDAGQVFENVIQSVEIE